MIREGRETIIGADDGFEGVGAPGKTGVCQIGHALLLGIIGTEWIRVKLAARCCKNDGCQNNNNLSHYTTGFSNNTLPVIQELSQI